MRKASYYVTLSVVAFILALVSTTRSRLPVLYLIGTFIAVFRTSSLRRGQTGTHYLSFLIAGLNRPNRSPSIRLVVRYEDVLHTRFVVTYGLTERCELTTAEVPNPSGDGKITYRSYGCKKFPPKQCSKEIEDFCSAWTSARYLDMIAIGFSAVSLAAIVFGVTTDSRRRRIWRAVAGLVFMAGELCMLLLSGRSELILPAISKVYSKLRRSHSSRSNIRMLLIRRSNEHDQVSHGTISIMAVSK